MDADANKPGGWDRHFSPTLARVNDLSIYELHVRDFSIGDKSVPMKDRGTYLAFTDTNSYGHEALGNAGGRGAESCAPAPDVPLQQCE